jgi:predicted alpha/beta-hydrolase family hydrolase
MSVNSVPGEPVAIDVSATVRVSGIWQLPSRANASLVLAHGAGAGMRHPFMEAVSGELAALGIATLRYQFPYMERGSKRTDPPELCHATVRAAVILAAALAPSLPRFAGGKSFGGRMSSQTQAEAALPEVRGLAFLGFPLHPPDRPSDLRAQHLFDVRVPMLFLQGTRDQFAQLPLLRPLVERLGTRATLRLFENADHSYHVPARTGVTDPQIRAQVIRGLADWINAVLTLPVPSEK